MAQIGARATGEATRVPLVPAQYGYELFRRHSWSPGRWALTKTLLYSAVRSRLWDRQNSKREPRGHVSLSRPTRGPEEPARPVVGAIVAGAVPTDSGAKMLYTTGARAALRAGTIGRFCGRGGTGRRTRLKILVPLGSAGSSPAARTI